MLESRPGGLYLAGTITEPALLRSGIVLALSLGVGTACRPVPAQVGPAPLACPPGHGSLVRDGLYFGLTEPGGQVIPESAWESFLSMVVTPAFPQGFTVLAANGQWRGADGQVIREPSRVLVLFHPSSDVADTSIRSIIQSYRPQFHQEAVLWERSLACAAF